MRRRHAVLAYAVALALLLTLSSMVAARDDAAGRLTLARFESGVQALLPMSADIARSARIWITGFGGVTAFLLAATGTLAVVRGLREIPVSFTFAACLAVAGQVALVWRNGFVGGLLYGLAAAALLAGRFRGESPLRELDASRQSRGFGFDEAAALVGVTLVAIFFRFYALNRVVGFFEGELSSYMVGATSLRGMSFANVGDRGPWAPLGYLYYLPIYATTHLFGTTVLAVRLASAVVSALTVPLLYGLVRRCAGRHAALAAAFLVALDPLQVGWGRSDIHPHGSTVWVAILLCWALLVAAEDRSRRALVAVAVLMGLAVHQYPSGQAAVVVPVLLLVWSAVVHRGADGLVRWSGAAAVAIGVTLWLAGLALPYVIAYGDWRLLPVFTVFGVRTSWHEAGDLSSLEAIKVVVGRIVANTQGLISGIWMHFRSPLHIQDMIPAYPDVPTRSVVWLGAALGLVTAAAAILEPKRRASALLVLWAFASALPLLLSDGSPPKRASNLYPALYALAGVGVAVLHRGVVMAWGWIGTRTAIAIEMIGATLFVLASLHQWFSGTIYPYGEPAEVVVARHVAPRIEPGTLVIGNFRHPHVYTKLSFLLLDRLIGTEESAWCERLPARDPVDPLRGAAQCVSGLPESLAYRWSDLWYRLPELQFEKRWSKVLLLSQTDGDHPENRQFEERLAQARAACPAGHYELLHEAHFRFQLFECERAATGFVDREP